MVKPFDTDAGERAEQLEIELKLQVDPQAFGRLADAVERAGGRFDARNLAAIYYDTPGTDLRRAGMSLRIRRSGEHRVQTVKADKASLGSLFSRSEWERPVDTDAPVIDDAAGPLHALPHATLEALRPAFTVQVRRRSAEVEHAGARVEVVLDRGAVVAGDARTEIAEVELELRAGPPAALFALARALDDAAPVRLGMIAKSEHGYRLLDGAAARVDKAAPALTATDLSAGDAFAAIAGACLRQFRGNEDLLAVARDPHALHQARVALRRLRSAVSIFRDIVSDDRFELLRAELRWLAATLGEARDLDVLIARIGRTMRLHEERERAYDRVAEALASTRARRLMLDLAEWLAIGAWRAAPAAAQLADRFAAHALDRLRRRVKRRGKRLRDLDDAARHEVRIAAKKQRYAAEFFAGLFAGGTARRRATRFIAAVAALQKHLGELNDLATAPALAARLDLPELPVAKPSHRRRLIRRAARAQEKLVARKRFWR